MRSGRRIATRRAKLVGRHQQMLEIANDQKAGIRQSIDELKSRSFNTLEIGYGFLAHIQSMLIEIAALVRPPRAQESQRFDDTTDFNPMPGIQQETNRFAKMVTVHSLALLPLSEGWPILKSPVGLGSDPALRILANRSAYILFDEVVVRLHCKDGLPPSDECRPLAARRRRTARS